ncbi:siderophore-iron reductase FhuF [Azohydromonas lata]|uniref:siderophore-iron reductase FhuF n=1 Tax=Azohydromonas lata TaxID=45677 RepID=UPI000A0051F0|nr:siderophore-iron reductase FhuF [Azohydromonas lata]
MIPLLAPIFQGEWARHGESLQCSSRRPADAVVLADLLHGSGLLTPLLRRHARHLGVAGQDQRAAASAWSLRYLWALLLPVVAAASLLHHRFEVGAAHIAVRFNEHGEVAGFHISQQGQALPGSGTALRYESLLHDHLDPLFAAIHQHTRLATKILWGNTARHLETIFSQALRLAGPVPGLVEDRTALLDRPAWPDGRDNPMHRRQAAAPAAGLLTLHRQCCLSYLLPGEGYCGACPLDPRHGKPCRHQAATGPA